MFGTISEEMEVKVAASEAWKVYGTIRLGEILIEKQPQLLQKVEVLEGDGGVGTVLLLTFPPGPSGNLQQKEKFTVVDDEKRVKVTEVIEGGNLDRGLDFFRVRFEIFEKQKQEEQGSCITKATVEYETKDLAAATNVAVPSIQIFVALMKAAADYLSENTNNN